MIKEDKMETLKRDQFEHENKTWERSLDFFKQENAFLKNRLSAVLDSKEDDNELLNLAEYFQNQFLFKDEFIGELKSDINGQNTDIRQLINGRIPTEILSRQEILRKEMSYFESDFSRLKNEFNQLITQFL